MWIFQAVLWFSIVVHSHCKNEQRHYIVENVYNRNSEENILIKKTSGNIGDKHNLYQEKW